MQATSGFVIPDEFAWMKSLSRTELLARLGDHAKEELARRDAEDAKHNWPKLARKEQLPPPIDWRFWLILAGRGFGKTRAGAEWVRNQVKKFSLVNIIGATSDDARDIMVDGESGILACCTKDERPEYLAHRRMLVWPNGARSHIFTADEPDRLRGKQHMKLWCDELAAWRYPEAWDQALLGLRLGSNPQAMITTTPRPTPLIRAVATDRMTVVTRGTTYDNRANLAPAFLDQIVKRYENTRIGRQELYAEILSDNPNALWKRENIEKYRVSATKVPQMRRIVIGLDPEATSNADSSETGIVAAGVGEDGEFYVLDDNSILATPDGWGREAIKTYKLHRADRIIGEVNNGGEMIEHVLRTIDRNVSYLAVRATRGKMVRAEPIAALYEQGRVHHVGCFSKLEDQMCDWDPATAQKSPDRMDALVWALTHLSETGADLGSFNMVSMTGTSAWRGH